MAQHTTPKTASARRAAFRVALAGSSLALLAAPSAHAYPASATSGSTIRTIAGTGAFCNLTESCGDGGAASSAALSGPEGVAVDGAGNLYIADFEDNRVRKVSSAGTITTIAGTGEACASATNPCGDEAAASSAELNGPTGVALDGAGNLYIADFKDNKIRKVSPAGTITTIAGTGKVCASATESCGDEGAGTSAELNHPTGIAIDTAGNLYIADTNNNRVRKVSPAGTITTVAGSGAACASATESCGDKGAGTSAELSGPRGVAVDGIGNLYIGDAGDNRVRKVSAGGTITTVAGTGKECASPTALCGDAGAASSAELNLPWGVAVDGAGNLYIADLLDSRIRMVSADGTITTVAGTGEACAPTTALCGDGGAASSAKLHEPGGVAVDGAGNLYIGDFLDNRIRLVTAPQAGPTGSTGPQGSTGLTGLPGPTGPAGPPDSPEQRPVKLVLVAFTATARHGHVTLRYALTGSASLTLSVKASGHRSATVARIKGRAGVGQISWNGKLHGKRAGHGVYTLTLTATAGAQRVASSRRVRL